MQCQITDLDRGQHEAECGEEVFRRSCVSGGGQKPYRFTFPSRPELAAQAEINFGVHSTLGVNLALVICFLFVYGVV